MCLSPLTPWPQLLPCRVEPAWARAARPGAHGGRCRELSPVSVRVGGGCGQGYSSCGVSATKHLSSIPRGKWSSDLIFSTLKYSNEFNSQKDLLTQPAERVFEGQSEPTAGQCDIFLASASCLLLLTPGRLIINEILSDAVFMRALPCLCFQETVKLVGCIPP